jgi:hypothetical protein
MRFVIIGVMELVLSFSYWEHSFLPIPSMLLNPQAFYGLTYSAIYLNIFLNFIARMQKSKGKHKKCWVFFMKIILNYKK